MDDIEVTVYEQLLNKHEKLLDKEERDHISSMKAERDYFNKMYPQGSAGGGFLDSIIKGITSKGIIGAGMAAGGVAGGIMILVDVIKNLTKESKILSMVQSTVSKAMGLLVDLILLPFLPLLVYGIMNLYKAIMWVGKIWDDWIKKTGVGGALDKVLNPPEGSTAFSRVLDFTNLINELAKAWFDGMKQLILGTALFVGEIGATILKFLWDIGWEIGSKTADAIWKVLEPWFIKFALFWENITKTVSEAWKRVTDGFEENFLKPLKNSINTLRDIFVNMINWVIDKINTILPPGFKIGTISAEAPKGDMGLNKPFTSINPATGNTFIFNGLQPEGLERQIKDILRTFGAGWIVP